MSALVFLLNTFSHFCVAVKSTGARRNVVLETCSTFVRSTAVLVFFHDFELQGS